MKFVITTILLLAIFGFPIFSYSYDCTIDTYIDDKMQKHSSEFEAGDKVHLKIFCKGLHPGKYRVSVTWSKQGHGAMRSDDYKFVTKQTRDREFYFWVKLGKMGFLNRLVSISDYNPKMMGYWSVESFLNDQNIGYNQFAIY